MRPVKDAPVNKHIRSFILARVLKSKSFGGSFVRDIWCIMAQFDCRDENDHSLSRSIVANLHFGNSHSVDNLISQTMKTTEQPPSGFPLESSSAEEAGSPDESKDCR